VTIQFACPTCKKTLKAPDEKAGAEGRCPACKATIRIPSLTSPGVAASLVARTPTFPVNAVQGLAVLALRPLVGYALTALGIPGGELLAAGVGKVVGFLGDKFKDESQRLPLALKNANEKAWQALEVALTGETFWKRLTAKGEDIGFAQQIRTFLDHVATLPELEGKSDFRQRCLDDLRKARQKGILTGTNYDTNQLARLTGEFARYADPVGLLDAEWNFIGQLAVSLEKEGHASLANLLKLRPPQGMPMSLLVIGVRYYFRRAIEEDGKLFQGVAYAKLEALGEAQQKGFAALSDALASQGQRLEELLGDVQFVVLETHSDVREMKAVAVEMQATVVATHGKALDMEVQLQMLASLNLRNADEFRRLFQEVMNRVSQIGMQKGEVKPQHSLSIRSEGEQQAVRQLLARFRQLPADQQKQVPALLNGLGKLQHGIGDFEGAKQSFVAVAESVGDSVARAEAYYNAYRAALEKKQWDDALRSIQQAASLAPERFAPFPMRRYQPKRILGAGGFGAAFLCHDRNFAEEVVVKAFHVTDMERSMDAVLQEARILGRLKHEAIIGVRDVEYADQAKQVRPYLVMDFFPGSNLETFVQEGDTLSPDHFIVVASTIAAGMRAAHQQNILHRDLKPANVLVRKEGDDWKVKIIDFGLALRRQVLEASTVKAAAGDTPLINSTARL
jgi:tetratricopeptide (TPR) repeat protein